MVCHDRDQISMTRVVPAIIARSVKELSEKLEVIKSFSGCSRVHIDIMDGNFVAGKTLSLEQLAKADIQIPFELHLMINHPEKKITVIKNLNAQKIMVHHESSQHLFPLLETLKKVKMTSEVALSPKTPADKALLYKNYTKHFLLMSVEPGQYGAKFLPQVFRKIQRLKKIFPNVHISIDGGVSAKNARKLSLLGVHQLCVGSQIFFADDPKEAYRELKKIVANI